MLTGEKVTLRPMQREDFKQFNELQQHSLNATLYGYQGWHPYSLAAMEKDFDKELNDKEMHSFAIQADGKLIGECGLYAVDRFNGTTCFGIVIYPSEYLGQGYGRDALKVLLYYIFMIQNLRRVWLFTMANNERAIRSYEACGFQIEARWREHTYFNGQYEDEVLMGLLREEWETLNFPPPILGKAALTQTD